MSAPTEAKATLMFHLAPNWKGEAHPTPAKQWCVVLSGELFVKVSDGETRSFHAGDLILSENTSGEGHVTWVEDAEATGMFVQVTN